MKHIMISWLAALGLVAMGYAVESPTETSIIPHIEYASSRSSSGMVSSPDGKTNYFVDRGITWHGITVYLTLTSELVAVDISQKMPRTLWCEHVGGFWNRMTFCELETQAGQKVWAVELRPHVNEAEGQTQVSYRDLRTGQVLRPHGASEEPRGTRLVLPRMYSGTQSRIGKPFVVTVSNKEHWTQFRKMMFDGFDMQVRAVDEVDFSKERMLIVSDGDSSNCRGIGLDSVYEDENCILVRLRRHTYQTTNQVDAVRPFGVFFLPRRETKTIVVESDAQRFIGGPPLWKSAARLEMVGVAHELDGLPEVAGQP